jgi:hypothetical protein
MLSFKAANFLYMGNEDTMMRKLSDDPMWWSISGQNNDPPFTLVVE